MSDWFPMNTAPKDGREIEVETRRHGLARIKWGANKFGYDIWLLVDFQGGILLPIEPVRWRPIDDVI